LKIRVVNVSQPKDLLVTLTVLGVHPADWRRAGQDLNVQALLAINAAARGDLAVSVGFIVKHLVTSHTVSAPRSRPRRRDRFRRRRQESHVRRPKPTTSSQAATSSIHAQRISGGRDAGGPGPQHREANLTA